MPSQDTFFKVKTGLGVGTDTLYASVVDQQVSIGKPEGDYTLDVAGDIFSENNVANKSIGIKIFFIFLVLKVYNQQE